jgi:TDP-4-keto-6-deoxy-D-glucose transaminase
MERFTTGIKSKPSDDRHGSTKPIPFNLPAIVGSEFRYIQQALEERHLFSDGSFTDKCHKALEQMLDVRKAFLTSSGSSALEMAAFVADIQPGDEVIVPSFTYITTASSFAIRGATPVFVDINADTLNLDESLVEKAITPKTRAVVPVHYAGVPCNMDALKQLSRARNILLIEDAAHAMLSTYKGKKICSFGDMSIMSFHAAKNIGCGEGGALFVNSPDLIDHAHTIWEKGSNKREFMEGRVNTYSWQSLSTSFALNEISAAFLLAQLEAAEEITNERLRIWERYQSAFEELESREVVRRPILLADTTHSAHIYYLLVRTNLERQSLLSYLNERGVRALFHYVPLHSSPAGVRHCRTFQDQLPITDSVSERLLRLPLWAGLEPSAQDEVIQRVYDYFA